MQKLQQEAEPKAKTSASQRQTEFVARKKAAGYVTLSSLYVPKLIATECRELVKNRVTEWEKANKF